jgi:hypothetical protein
MQNTPHRGGGGGAQGEQEVTWELQPATIQNLTCDSEYVFFSWQEHVYAYSEAKGEIVR